MRGGEPPDGPWLVYRLHERAEGCPVAFEKWEKENIPQFKANALDRLVAAGKIRDIDRERVTFSNHKKVPSADHGAAVPFVPG